VRTLPLLAFRTGGSDSTFWERMLSGKRSRSQPCPPYVPLMTSQSVSKLRAGRLDGQTCSCQTWLEGSS
jgi:hypothetical protein